MKNPVSSLTFALALCLAPLHAADPAETTKIRVKEIAAGTYFCTKKELKIEDFPDFIRSSIGPLTQAHTDLKLGYRGPTMTTYIGYQGDASKPFTAEIGIPVQKKADDYKGPYFFRDAPKFKCAAIIYQGEVAKIGGAWMSLVEQAMAAGHQPTGDSREVYLVWDGEKSPNNIVELQFGVK